MDDAVGMDGLLGAAGILELGAVSDARLSGLAPRPLRAGSWWSAPGRGGSDVVPVVDGTEGGGPVADPVEPTPRQLVAVRQVLHSASSVVTWTDGVRRGAFVVADGVVLIDTPADGLHHLTLATPAVATAVLAIGLDPLDRARHGRHQDTGVVVDRPVDLLAGPPRGPVPTSTGDAPAGTVHVARVTVGPPPGELLLTVVPGDEGLLLVRALPDGRTARRLVDRDAVVAAAVALLTGPPPVVAA